MTDELLDPLDAEQREVATTFGVPVSVHAGAGTGKTRALTHRIAYGVREGHYSPARVMALTFTSRSAGELRGRLSALGVAEVTARTIHSAALSQIGYFWPTLTESTAPSVLSSKSRTLSDAALKLKISLDAATARDLAAEIEWRKVQQRSWDHYVQALDSGERSAPGRLSQAQSLALMQAYEKLKDERRQIDFEDVLVLCAGMLYDEPTVLDAVREQYRHFLVDEFQDLSPIQFELLRLWLGERQDLCVVGDPNQSIFSFAGASARFLLDFPRYFDNTVEIQLQHNYRSSPEIVETANALMRGREGSLRLIATAEEGPKPQLWIATDDRDEAVQVARDIALRVAAGIDPSTIAVLYRINAQSALLETALAEARVSYRVRGATSFFERPEVKQALMSLRGEAIATTATKRPLFQTVSDVLRSLGWTHTAPDSTGAVRERWESLNALAGLADSAPPGTTLREFTDQLKERAAMGHEVSVAAVTLATIHSAKGLEWDVVYVIGASEGLLPFGTSPRQENVDEERRLMYVALTRARRVLVVSHSKQGERLAREPSRFLSEIGTRTSGEPSRRVFGADRDD